MVGLPYAPDVIADSMARVCLFCSCAIFHTFYLFERYAHIFQERYADAFYAFDITRHAFTVRCFYYATPRATMPMLPMPPRYAARYRGFRRLPLPSRRRRCLLLHVPRALFARLMPALSAARSARLELLQRCRQRLPRCHHYALLLVVLILIAATMRC